MTWDCKGLGISKIGIVGVEIGTIGSRALERSGGRETGSTGKLVSKVGVGENGLSLVDGGEITCRTLLHLVSWVVNCNHEWITRAHWLIT